MSRAVVYQTLVNSAELQALGFDNAHILVNYDGEQRPNIPFSGTNQYFMVLRWGPQDFDPRMYRGPRHFDIWIHMGREFSTDFGHLDDVIEILDSALTSIIDVPGADGRSVTCIEMEGRSRDLYDESYNTICRQASYKMISRMTATAAE